MAQEKKIFNALSEIEKQFIFKIEPKNTLHKVLQKIRVIPSERILNVSPIKYGVRGICATFINKASFDKYSNNTVFKAGTLFAEHEIDNVIMFLAYVLWNKQTTPPDWLIEGIKNKNQKEIDEIIQFAHESIDINSFINSIISMTGVSLQTEEIIAAENPEHTK